MKIIDNELIERLAGPAAYQRGQDYFRIGHVIELKKRGNTITALVGYRHLAGTAQAHRQCFRGQLRRGLKQKLSRR